MLGKNFKNHHFLQFIHLGNMVQCCTHYKTCSQDLGWRNVCFNSHSRALIWRYICQKSLQQLPNISPLFQKEGVFNKYLSPLVEVFFHCYGLFLSPAFLPGIAVVSMVLNIKLVLNRSLLFNYDKICSGKYLFFLVFFYHY